MFINRRLAIQAEEILKFVGLPVSDVDFKRWLWSTGNEELILEEGDYQTYIERPENGYCLTFTDEAVFLGIEDKAIGSGSLFFSGVFFYSEGKDGYKQFEGKLPKNVEFNNISESLRDKLGTAQWGRHDENGSPISERWEYERFQFHITYNNSGSIDNVSISQPDKT